MNLRQSPKPDKTPATKWLTFTLPNGEQAAIQADEIVFFISNREPVPHTVLYTRASNLTVIEPFSDVAEMLGFTPPEPPPVPEIQKPQIITPSAGIIRAH